MCAIVPVCVCSGNRLSTVKHFAFDKKHGMSVQSVLPIIYCIHVSGFKV